MPEVNRVPFKFDPVRSDLYLDSFRRHFYMERVDDVVDTLSTLCVDIGVAYEIEGEVKFTDDDDSPPEIRDLRYSNPTRRRENGNPFEDVDEPVVVS